MRIVSLLPSITEIVCALGLEDQLVGITHECDHPPDVTSRVARVTTSILNPAELTQAQIDHKVANAVAQGHSLYGLDEALLAEAAPTHVFTQALCEVCAVAEPTVRETVARVISEGEARVVSLEPTNLEEVFASIVAVGRECGVEHRASKLVDRLRYDLDAATVREPARRARVAFLEWIDPPFSGGHWVPEMIALAGGHDVLGAPGEPSRRETVERLVSAAPEVIVVGPCGFDVRRAVSDALPLWEQPWWRELPAVKAGQVYAVHANAQFSRPGPRLVEGVAVLARILHGVESTLVPGGSWTRIAPEAA